MRIENGIKVKSKRGSFIPTKMVSFRAEHQTLEMIKNQMQLEQIDNRSEFILKVLTDYCRKNG